MALALKAPQRDELEENATMATRPWMESPVKPGMTSGAPSGPGRVHSRFAAAEYGLEAEAMPSEPCDMIIEPSPEELLNEILPKVQRLKIYTVLLDSNAAEHAARTVAMQTATDNGNDLLESLTLEYNKGRQQKITSEILDIVGGSLQ